ncbi:hypothetical protein ASG52_15495 [Methylobacterium sp. Leaf456]|uniref:hypothetical protein n=1 Tax=Methylobacterium sp. Leaf456 TaxID=1736382 RepID=UPI0006FA10AB|nr:hypothetical protein [Methylobacterium sp. Leaf456]KQT45553.1 hypothetical protein ASG52_15495 [Methylobacterium sp. Leaf456]
MTNFFLGLIAGCIIAGVVTISAARNPSVQTRLGLMPAAQAAAPAPAPVARIEPPHCPEARAETTVGRTDMLFSRSRLWSIKP